MPTVNIGERQRGRLAAESVFSCPSNTAAIIETLQLGLKSDLTQVVNPYGKGKASEAILKQLKAADVSVVKTFYELQEST